MGEMKNKTVADIVVEYRVDADEMDAGALPQPTTKYLCILLDRIEAAWKRERAEIEANALAVGGVVEAARHKPSGNAAAMREALCDIVMLTMKVGYSIRGDVACGIIASKAKHALAAPPCNCERFLTWEAAKAAYWREQGDPADWRKLGAWLFAAKEEVRGEGLPRTEQESEVAG